MPRRATPSGAQDERSGLRTPTILILLSLASGQKHGYAILKDVEVLSEGSVQLSAGTLYEALNRLLEQGWISRVEDNAAEHSGRVRKAYRLNAEGRRALEAELDRLQQLLALAHRQLRPEQP